MLFWVAVIGPLLLITRSGAGAGATGTVGVIGEAVLLPVTVSTGTKTAPLKTGWVPTVLPSAVTGTLTVLLSPGNSKLGCRQVTVWPLVLHDQVPSVKVIGAVVPSGNSRVAETIPEVAPLPILATVIGIVLLMVATKSGVT